MLHALNREVDSLLEECVRERASLAQTFHRLLPVGAAGDGGAGRRRHHAQRGARRSRPSTRGTSAASTRARCWPTRWATRREGEGTVVSQDAGRGGPVGGAPRPVPGGRPHPPEQAGARWSACWTRWPSSSTPCCCWCTPRARSRSSSSTSTTCWPTPSSRRAWTRRCWRWPQRVRVPGFLLVYRDAVRPSVLHYRSYRNGHLEHESGEQTLPVLDAVLRAHGPELLARGDERLKRGAARASR